MGLASDYFERPERLFYTKTGKSFLVLLYPRSMNYGTTDTYAC